MEVEPKTISENEPRAVCYRCEKAKSVCVCGSIVPVNNKTGIYIIQHPRERGHSLGTVRFAKIGLTNTHIEVCGQHEVPGLAKALPPKTSFLFPGPNAVGLEDLAPHERPDNILMLDGTWNHAKIMLRNWPWLFDLPQLTCRPTQPSQYRIRREPRFECVSSIEAVVYALRCLEPELKGLDQLLEGFAKMIDTQVEYAQHSVPRPRKPKRSDSRRAIPRALESDGQNVVIVYAEFAAEIGNRNQELVSLSAVRPATGEVFHELVTPKNRSRVEPLLPLMGLDADFFVVARPAAEVEAAWQRFCKEGDVVLAWGKGTLSLLQSPPPQNRFLLKTIYCNLRRLRAGHLSDVITRENITAGPTPVPGRAGTRLANAIALFDYLVKLAACPASNPRGLQTHAKDALERVSGHQGYDHEDDKDPHLAIGKEGKISFGIG
ncbi:MAG: hypothetical protein A2341_05335 [Deltaproteobacteria bacterium RIFOXYB12_FULL_58_9]|nr:MAG: hypothetical protein A2341_05335 [Deltaproteobacteria bacterium RIFOXYB12_FULL_58_9]